MATYLYECPTHGRVEVVRPMPRGDERMGPEWCAHCLATGAIAQAPMRRLYTGQAFIIRPSGWALRPGDRGYADFNRELELGEVRDPGAIDLHGRVADDEIPFEAPDPAPEALQELHEMGRVIDRQIREEMDLPSAVLDLVGR